MTQSLVAKPRPCVVGIESQVEDCLVSVADEARLSHFGCEGGVPEVDRMIDELRHVLGEQRVGTAFVQAALLGGLLG